MQAPQAAAATPLLELSGEQASRHKHGRLTLPDGMSYRVLVLPERETMTPGLLTKVKELVESGANPL